MSASKKTRNQRSKLQGADLGKLSADWRGWQVVGSRLIGPLPGMRLSARVSVHDIRAIPMMLAKIEEQRQEIKALNERIRDLEQTREMQEQPRPEP